MRRLIFCFALLGASVLGTSAQAGRGAAIINYGDEIFDLGPVLPDKPEMRIGRRCQHLGLFWADVWTWDCRIVLANEDLTRYRELPAEMKDEAERLYANARPSRGVWNQYGIFVILFGIALSILLKAVQRAASGSAPGAGQAAEVPTAAPASSPVAGPPPARIAAAAGGARPSFGRRGVA